MFRESEGTIEDDKRIVGEAVEFLGSLALPGSVTQDPFTIETGKRIYSMMGDAMNRAEERYDGTGRTDEEAKNWIDYLHSRMDIIHTNIVTAEENARGMRSLDDFWELNYVTGC